MRNVKKIRFDANRLAVASGGTGEPAVFVHGLGSNKFIWIRVCDGLRDVFSFYAIDLPGCGESPAPAHFRYTLEHFADVLTDFIVMKDLKKLLRRMAAVVNDDQTRVGQITSKAFSEA